MTIDVIDGLKTKEQNFWLELASGRIVQIYDSRTVALCNEGRLEESTIGILRDGGFEIIAVEAIIACGAGEHPKTTEALEKRRAEIRARFGD
jgi:hypothetical protein